MDFETFQRASERTIDTRTTAEQRMLNAALGLCGEAAEVVEAAFQHAPTEEVGDCLWYMCQLQTSRNASIATLDYLSLGLTNNNLYLLIHTGQIADLVKKHLFHQRPLDDTRLDDLLGLVLTRLHMMLAVYDVSIEAAMEQNVLKLARRFPSGFSYAAANARADEIQPAD